MSDLTRIPATDPTDLYRARDEIYATDMLIAAIRGLDLFTRLDAHPASVQEIAQHYGFHERPVDVMTTLFVAMGLLERNGAALRPTPLAREHLVATSPWFAGPYFPAVDDRPIARDLIGVLNTGAPSRFAGRAGQDDWHRAMQTAPVAAEFTAAMDCRGLVTAPALVRNVPLHDVRLLDVAGGSGVYACAYAAAHPGLRATVLERPPVDRVAAGAIAARGLQDRVSVMAGVILRDPLPAGFDVHLFSNVLHDWDTAVVRQLLASSARTLAPGGRIVVQEAFLDADKSGPLAIARYSVLIMHVTQGRCYSTAEIGGWLKDAGFDDPQQVPTALGRRAMIAAKR
jgi:acetylserotonin N-methyltransferase